MKVRRVATGHDAQGKAVVVSDIELDGNPVPQQPGGEYAQLWGGDHAPRYPDDGSEPKISDFFPPVGGHRFWMFTVPPESFALEAAIDQAKAATDSLGLTDHMEQDNPGMHRSGSIDFSCVVSGEAWLELDDGVLVHVREGDTVVQNGTRHAWRNKGTELCQIVVFMAGATQAP